MINGENGSDVLRGGAGDDLMNGGANNDLLFGQGGENRMLGVGGDDRLIALGESTSAEGTNALVTRGNRSFLNLDQDDKKLYFDDLTGGTGARAISF